MEYALRDVVTYVIDFHFKSVLILVLMEYALRDSLLVEDIIPHLSLNPCFNGICSARKLEEGDVLYVAQVS